MKSEIIKSLRAFLVLSILLGIIYPFLITVIGQIIISDNANGSLITNNQKIIGSKLIGQSFTKPEYFHSRPSATNYNASASGGSNLGPSSKKLITQTEQRIMKLRAEEGLNPQTPIPAEMVLQSASGIDPHVSLNNALLQVPRISKARGMPESSIIELLHNNMDTDFLGIWGESVVNVLKLNLALDSQK